MSPLNSCAAENIISMLVTLDTSHRDMSSLNSCAPENIELISGTADTSHDPIGPCGPSEQPAGSFRHSLTAAWSFFLEFGKNAGVEYRHRHHIVGLVWGLHGKVRVKARDLVMGVGIEGRCHGEGPHEGAKS